MESEFKRQGPSKNPPKFVINKGKEMSGLSLSGSGTSKNSSDDDDEWKKITALSNS